MHRKIKIYLLYYIIMKENKIISFANHKGGVGKTTSTASVGSILAQKGFRVLLVDLDAQANLTACFHKGEVVHSVYDSLVADQPLPVVEVGENINLVPASEQLAMIDVMLASAISREKILAEKLAAVRDQYDYILIDCPPSLGLMTLNAFTASNEIVIPLVAEVLPFKGLKMISNFIGMIHRRLNPQAHISGVLITPWENTNLSRQIEDGLRGQLDGKVFATKIRKNVSIAEAPLKRVNIVDYAPKSNGAADYKAFTEELLEKVA